MWNIIYAITRQPKHHNLEFPTHRHIKADTQTCMVESQCKVLKLGAKCSSCIRTTKMYHQNGEKPKIRNSNTWRIKWALLNATEIKWGRTCLTSGLKPWTCQMQVSNINLRTVDARFMVHYFLSSYIHFILTHWGRGHLNCLNARSWGF